MTSELYGILSRRLGWTLLHSVWQFSLIAALLAIGLVVVRRHEAHWPYALRCVALSLMAGSATLTFVVVDRTDGVRNQQTDAVELPVATAAAGESLAAPSPRSSSISAGNAAHLSDSAGPSDISSAAAITDRPQHRSAAPVRDRVDARPLLRDWLQDRRRWMSEWMQNHLQLLLACWGMGILTLSIRPLIAWRHIRQLRANAVRDLPEVVCQSVEIWAARLGIGRAVDVAQSAGVTGPTVIGWLRPLILLPASSLTGLSGPQLEALLVHELSHVRRHDALVNAGQVLLETIFFYHPAVWWVSRGMRRTREECCDQMVVRVTGDRLTYANALLWLDQHTAAPRSSVLAISATDGVLLHRIRRLVQVDNPMEAGSGPLITLLLMTCFAISGLLFQVGGQNASTARADDIQVATTDFSHLPYAEAVSEQFAASLLKRNLSFMKDRHVEAFRRQMEDYLQKRIPPKIRRAVRETAVAAVQKWVQQVPDSSQGYLRFVERFDMLRWQLWTYAARPELSLRQRQERKKQRDWMRNYIRQLPPKESAPPQWQHDGRLALLEDAVFSNPLNPFFHSPMPAQRFEQFQSVLHKHQKSLGDRRIIHAPAHIFMAGVTVSVEPFRTQFPPDFPVGGLSIGGEQSFGFRASSFPNDASLFLNDRSFQSSRHFYDGERNIVLDLPPGLSDGEAKRWQQQSKADLYYDAKQSALIPINGAKLATIDATRWSRIDQMSVPSLAERVRQQSLDRYPLAPAQPLDSPISDDQKLRSLPTGVLLTSTGRLILFRIQQQYDQSVLILFRPRPLPAYPPFHQGDPDVRPAAPTFPTATTTRTSQQIPGHSVLWFRSDDHVHFVLYHSGFLQTGLNYSQSLSGRNRPPRWKFEGIVNGLSGQKRQVDGRNQWEHTRQLRVLFKNQAGELSLQLGNQPFNLAQGRVFVLPQSGPPVQVSLPPPPLSAADHKEQIIEFAKQIQAAGSDERQSRPSKQPTEGRAILSGRILTPNGTTAELDGVLYYHSSARGNSVSGNATYSQGRFSLEVPAGRTYLYVFPDQFAPAWTSIIDAQSGDVREDLTLQLQDGWNQTIVIRNTVGAPVPAATLVAHPLIHGSAEGPISKHTSAADGTIGLQHLANVPYELTVTAAGYQTLQTDPMDLPQKSPLRLILQPAEPATGTVIDVNGRPVPGAKLRALYEVRVDGPNQIFSNDGPGFYGHVMTEADQAGQFKLDSLNTGSHYLFLIEGPDGARTVSRQLRAGVEDARIELPPRMDLMIRVTGDVDALPVRKGRPYAVVRQHIRIHADNARQTTLVGSDIYLKKTDTGATAEFQGLVVDGENQTQLQSAQVRLGYNKSSEKVVSFDSRDQPSVRFDLP